MFPREPGPCQWPEHWTNGGTGVTKLNADKIPFAEAAIAELNDPDLFISNGALHDHRGVLRGGKGLGDFWNTYRRLIAESQEQQP